MLVDLCVYLVRILKKDRDWIYGWYTKQTHRSAWFCLWSALNLTKTWFYRILHMYWNVAVSLTGVNIWMKLLSDTDNPR